MLAGLNTGHHNLHTCPLCPPCPPGIREGVSLPPFPDCSCTSQSGLLVRRRGNGQSGVLVLGLALPPTHSGTLGNWLPFCWML